MWFRHLLVGLAVLCIGLLVRVAMVQTANPDLTPDDLHRFETTFGLDLPDWYAGQPFFLLWTRGDGQAFVALASDLDLDGAAQELAVPIYRYTRIGYAWLGRVAALGRVSLVPVGLMAVNALALLALGVLSSQLAQTRGRVAYLLAANPAVYVGFASDTAEPLGVVLLVAALVTSSKAVGRWSSGWLAAVRPSLATALPARRRDLPITLIGFGVIAVVVRIIGTVGLGGNSSIPPSTLVLPVTGYVEAWRSLSAGAAVVAGIPLAAGLTTFVLGMVRERGWMRLAWLATGLLVLTLGSAVLRSPVNWTRAAAALPVLWVVSSLTNEPTLDPAQAPPAEA
ncbi:MAG: hypothetical protein OEY62_08790 [Acidimicrobiia bacterium]|nr:hypothetical protein [Acidimicrobiia bacterium]